MPAQQCAAVTTPDTIWAFCPNLGAAYAFAVFFGLTFCTHVAQGIYYRKAYTWVIAMSALWQMAAYIFRVLSINAPASLGAYAAWFVLILVAPLWTNAFVYMVMGRMVWNFTSSAKVFGITAWNFTAIFVILDIITFFIQVYGAASTQSSPTISASEVLKDLHIYMAGVGVQQFFILVFLACAIQFHRTILQERKLNGVTKSKAMTLLYTLYTCLVLITMRIIFRLVEYSDGLESTIPSHEAYQYCLDSLPMLLALVLLNVVHPGRLMSGQESDMPSRKQRKSGLRTKPNLDYSALAVELKNGHYSPLGAMV
ncbi:hypothetical protein LTR37_000074 [Vermiconidia calcicola]|uniref:Uncharacterized protein n=1 Tax=Vermiconidia calcicola TaxID=1690605 RepID=A0ACC3NZE0_9PEZI|nr:hypothetical protein LTR37_000074 [Vermiconidia calcicola]